MDETRQDGHPDVTFDRDRGNRIGIEEAVLSEHKSADQIASILHDAVTEERRLLMTRLSAAQYAGLPEDLREAVDYCKASRTAILGEIGPLACSPRIALASAGTSDYAPMAEAKRTLAYGGLDATEFCDVGVAGLWRLLAREEQLREMDVVIVFAGMDAALPSVIAGLVPGVVIGVPTSVGYGVASGGRVALDSILASCAPGVTVVNIDNGYGAATSALRMANMMRRAGAGSRAVTAPKLKIKKRQTLADQLYGQILEQIVSNKLVQGERLPSENQIATAFGVSRPVVREALRKLQEDGLAEARRGVGTFVRRRPSEKLIEFATAGSVAGLMRAMEARITVEKATARMAALRANPKDLTRIETALHTLEASMQSRTPSFEADYQFHRAIAAASGNEVFIQMLDCAREAIEQGIDVAQKLTREGSQVRIDTVIREHRQILEAIRAGDSEAAGVSMAYHLLQARTRITDHAGLA